MDCVFPSSKEANLEHHEEDLPLFLHFSSPLLDDIISNPLHLPIDRCEPTSISSQNKPLSIIKPPPFNSKEKCVRKKRSGGKKDRHSKIRTAQGLRDRRMRLSLHTARKFFDLQDMLGFDKASKTIEWLFCKSSEAIKEFKKSQSGGERISIENTEVEMGLEVKSKKSKTTESNHLTKELRNKARARAKERTRERLMINHLEKTKELLIGQNPNDVFDQSQLGFSENPNNQYLQEYAYCSPLDNIKKIDIDLGNTYASSSTHCANNPLLGLIEGWECNSYGDIAPLIDDVNGQNLLLFQPHNQGK